MIPAVIGAAFGAGLAAGAAALFFVKTVRSRSVTGRLTALVPKKAVRDWEESAEEKLSAAGLKVRGRLYTLGVLVAASASFFVGIFAFRNFTAALLMATAAVLLPDRLVLQRREGRKLKMLEQMIVAVRIFAAEFNQTPQVERALKAAAAQVPPPLGTVLQDACRSLLKGASFDEALFKLMSKLEFAGGRMFVQLIMAAKRDSSVAPLFGELVTRLAVQLELARKNRSVLYADRLLSWVMLGSMVPAFLVMRLTVPETGEFLTATVAGRVVVTLCFLSVIVWTVMDRLAGRVEV
jgi:pilus assembly protein CpaF